MRLLNQLLSFPTSVGTTIPTYGSLDAIIGGIFLCLGCTNHTRILPKKMRLWRMTVTSTDAEAEEEEHTAVISDDEDADEVDSDDEIEEY